MKKSPAAVQVAVEEAIQSTADPSRSTVPWDGLRDTFRRLRRATELLCEPLDTEDFVVQTMPEVSPTKWHLGHTSWFFETFVLRRGLPAYAVLDGRYAYIFNSYYHAAGQRHPQSQRGLLSRPTVRQVLEYRRHVDGAMETFFAGASARTAAQFAFVIELGINHEEQHQELILTDIKHVLSSNPLEPVYQPIDGQSISQAEPIRWIGFEGGIVDVGHAATDFAFDNEKPRHQVHLAPFELASRPVSCGEYLAFMQDGGYQRPELWLSDGWDAVLRGGWRAPLYWTHIAGSWQLFSLHGRRRIDPSEAVCHISYYEADAFARWAGARLPLEEEWEKASTGLSLEGNLLEAGHLHPRPAPARNGSALKQMFGDIWEWTGSAYLPYPGFVPFAGALGEYNGKFMSSRMVLRGGSCATPRRHIRHTYRNFFAPETRWQFSGLRLARAI